MGHRNEQIIVINLYYMVVFMKLYRLTCYQCSGKREYLFHQYYYFWNDSLEMVLLRFKLFLSPTRLCLGDVHQFAKAELFPLTFTSNIYVYHIKSFKCSTFLKKRLMVSMNANVCQTVSRGHSRFCFD